MQDNLTNKTIAIASFVLFVIISVAPSAMSLTSEINDLYDSSWRQEKNKVVVKSKNIFNPDEEYDYSKSSASKLKIEDITGGIGLSFILKNEGNSDVTNIELNIECIGKFMKILSPNYIKIPLLAAGKSTEIKVKLSGLGFGEPVYNSRILITASASNVKTVKRTIIVNVLGPLVDVIRVFINDEDSFEGYTLISPEYSSNTYLIDKDGKTVHSWECNYIQCVSSFLLENGNLVRNCLSKINPTFLIGGATGRVEIFDWNGTLIWEFEYSDNKHCLHHDIEPLPNGNILMIAWELKSFAEAISAGRNPFLIPAGVLWSSYIIEVDPKIPDENIVWEWHVWDHLIQDYDPTKENFGVVANHPELIDINYGTLLGLYDSNHVNSLDYNEEFDQILISSHIQNEIWIIDHSTTPEEAAGHTGGRYGKGGDILYRWGNPQVYRAGDADDQWFFGQHDARWIEKGCPGEGNILVFNNGLLRPDSFYSSVDEIVPPVNRGGEYYLEADSSYGPKEPVWNYVAENPTDFFASIQSGAQRLFNGNTLICDGPEGIIFEVNREKELVWKYINLYPNLINTRVDKMEFYPPDYPGLGDFNIKNIKRFSEGRFTNPINYYYNILDVFNRFLLLRTLKISDSNI